MAEEGAKGATATAPPPAATKPATPDTKPDTTLAGGDTNGGGGTLIGGKGEKAADGTTLTGKNFELKLPENSLLDDGAIKRTAEFAKKRGLSQDQAQAVLESESGAVSAYMEAQKGAFEEKAVAWMDETKSDKEIGGVEFTKNVEIARRIVDRFGSAPLKQALNSTGLGNHPELVRLLVRVGKMMTEDQLVMPGKGGSPKSKAIEDIIYPNG